MTLEPNTTVSHYKIISSIGKGGMGEVYKAKDLGLDREVAIKILPPEFAGEKDRLLRFEQEAKATSALNHPNILTVYEFGLHEDSPFIVAELLEGEELRDRLDEGSLSFRDTLNYARQIISGLAAAHEKGVIHRDLKPENIFITNDNRIKILDFGLAKIREPLVDVHGSEDATKKAITEKGAVMGTAGYMSPEQVRGEAIDHRSDIFSFGVLLFEMLTGKRLFEGNSLVETMHAILKEDVPETFGEDGPTIPPAVDSIMRRCLEKKRERRFHSAHDLGFALEALSTSTSSSGSGNASVLAGLPDNEGPSRRWRYPAIAAAILLLTTAGVVLWFFGSKWLTSDSDSIETKVSYQPLTFEKGFVFAARFAPDGKTVVYSADWEGQPRQLYVTSVDSPEYRPLGFPGADLLGISPSGELAVLTDSQVLLGNAYYRTGTLAKASLTGGASRPELENVQFADFGPNDAMAVARIENGRSAVEFPVGSPVTEKTDVSTTSKYSTPRVSRSGDHLAFFDTTNVTGVFVTILDGAKKPIAKSRIYRDWWGVAWKSPNEVWFAAAEAAGREVAIFGLDTVGKERTIIRLPGSITLHDISPNGDVLISLDRNNSAIEMIDGANLPKDRSWRELSRLGGVSSNDTVLINELGYSGGTSGSVHIWKPDDTQSVKIADGIGLALTPDAGKALVSLEGPEPTVSIVPTGVGKPQKLKLDSFTRITWGSWLPDGRILIQAKRTESADPQIIILTADGQDPTPLFPAGIAVPEFRGRTGFSGISPDGTRMVAADATGKPVLCMIGTGKCEPIRGMDDNESPAGWSPDGSNLLVYQKKPGEIEIHKLDPRSGNRSLWKKVSPSRSSTTGIYSLFVSAKGTIVYGYQEETSKLYLVRGLK